MQGIVCDGIEIKKMQRVSLRSYMRRGEEDDFEFPLFSTVIHEQCGQPFLSLRIFFFFYGFKSKCVFYCWL